MADTPPVPSSEPSTPPSSAADQARIRKERREAKIRAGGSARLNKITGLGGGIQRDPPPQPTASNPTDDPAEVDISNHYYEPKSRTSRQNNSSPSPFGQQGINDDQLRQMMLGFDPSGAPPPGANANPFAGFPGMGGMGGMPGMEGMGGEAGEDPMMKMLQQMMSGMPGDGAGGMPSFPGMPPVPGQAAASGDPYAYLWRIVHAVFALGLGLYIAFTTPFTGTKIARERSGLGYTSGDELVLSPSSVHFFWIFATVEVLLQTSRFFFEKGRVQQGGIMGMVMGFLPEPWKGYLALIARYSRIWTTVSGDAMVCVFVLGVCAWLKGN
ncbi:hypothetical protein IFR05_000595 [Cadophora sp. M221]|nr:hypothetical protein IFR05_000595 [Cadophora sp. M221]